MNILLTGASGFVGGNLALALGADGHRVRPVSRRHGVDFRGLQNPEDWLPLLCGVDAVINAVGIIGETRGQLFSLLHQRVPQALFHACVAAGVRKVVQISALGADETAFSAYHLSKRAADDCLRGLDLDGWVLRPSLIYGRGGKSAELFMRLAALPRIPVIGDGRQALQPVHIRDVVAAVRQCLRAGQGARTVDLVGERTIAFAAWLQRLRRVQGLPRARLLHIPFALALASSRLIGPLLPIFRAETLRMLQKGYHADSAPFRRFLGRPPLPMDDALFFCDGGPFSSAGRAS